MPFLSYLQNIESIYRLATGCISLQLFSASRTLDPVTNTCVPVGGILRKSC